MATTIGVISDTHGLLRPQALDALRGCHQIIHAGDIGDLSLLQQLQTLAPVTAVWGNTDGSELRAVLPETAVVEVEGVRIFVIHILAQLRPADAEGCAAVIFGHSHKPEEKMHDGMLYLNPGSAGPRRFQLPVALARLQVTGVTLSSELITLL